MMQFLHKITLSTIINHYEPLLTTINHHENDINDAINAIDISKKHLP